MDPSSTAKSERITAIVSTLVAIAILAAGVTAQQSHNAPNDDLVQLESDLRFQLENAFRHDAGERARRLAQLGQVVQAWQQAPRSEADRELLAAWLLEATIRSMPGSGEPMPAIPEFGKPAIVPATPQADIVVEPELPQVVPAANVAPTPVKLTPEISAFEPTTVAPTPTPAVQSQRSVVTKIFASPQPAPAGENATINLTELAARIAGYHDGLDEVDTRLLTLESPALSVLAAQVKQIDELARDFRFVKLYYDALTDQERRTVVPPRSMEPTLAEILRQLNRSQPDRSADFLDDFDTTRREQIDKLREQLSAVADRVAR